MITEIYIKMCEKAKEIQRDLYLAANAGAVAGDVTRRVDILWKLSFITV